MKNGSTKKLLALDGGGILGLISLGVLEQIESQLRHAQGNLELRLRDYFDYIGGTSTGAIIAAGLSVGKSVAEIREIYTSLGERMFDQASLLRRWRYAYEADNLREELKRQFGEGSILDHQRAGTLREDRHLLIVTRNVNTDSPWPVSTNPKARYNDESRDDCNRLLPLWQLIRASTAAPTFFAPERLELSGDKSFYFEDGGMTAYNNPAFLLYRMATEPAYRCRWATGEEEMMLVSIGTGMAFRPLGTPSHRGEGLLTSAKTIPSELMRSIAVEQDIACRTVGRCVHGGELERELGDLMTPHDPERPKAFVYARYDIDISEQGLKSSGLADIDAGTLAMDNAAAMPELLRIGAVAGQQVNMRLHFPAFV